MSVENLKKFGMRCAQNEEVRKRAKEIGLNDLDGLMAYGREMELEFTREDMTALAKDAGVSRQELSEEQLELVAGGVATTTALVTVGVALAMGLAGGMAAGIVVGAASCKEW